MPELLQDDFTVEDFLAQAIPLLDDGPSRARIHDGYRRLRETLGTPGVTDRAAAAIHGKLVGKETGTNGRCNGKNISMENTAKADDGSNDSNVHSCDRVGNFPR